MNTRQALPLVALTCMAVSGGAAAQVADGYDWSGPYAGFSIGVTHNDGDAERAGGEGAIIENDIEIGIFPKLREGGKGFALGGATLGFNVQRGNFVAGVEADAMVLDQDFTVRFSVIDPGPSLFEGLRTITTYTTDIDNFISLRARGGVVRDRNFYFATVGLAGADVANNISLELPALPYESPSNLEEGFRTGWIAGIGFERQLSERLTLKAEVLHFDLEDVVVDGRDDDTPAFVGNVISYAFQNDGTIARIGLNFRF